MTKEQALDLIKLLSAVESWSFADKHRMPDYLYDKIDENMKVLDWRYEITANGQPSVSRAYAEKQLGLEPVHILSESKRRA